MDEVYCYTGTETLRNKLDIHNKDRLNKVEIRLTAIRLYQLYENPIQGVFDFQHLCDIHRHIFQDLYTWAGRVRTVNIAKANMFCLVQHIQTYAQTIFPAFREDCMFNKDNFESFIHTFAEHYANLNALHPFREGNGRSQRAFSQQLCLACGYSLDLTRIGHGEMIEASVSSFGGDNTGLETLFRRCIERRKNE